MQYVISTIAGRTDTCSHGPNYTRMTASNSAMRMIMRMTIHQPDLVSVERVKSELMTCRRRTHPLSVG